MTNLQLKAYLLILIRNEKKKNFKAIFQQESTFYGIYKR